MNVKETDSMEQSSIHHLHLISEGKIGMIVFNKIPGLEI